MNKFKMIGITLLMAIAACTNIKQKKLLSTTGDPSSYLDALALTTHVLRNITLTTDTVTQGGDPTKTLSLSVDSSVSGFTSLQNYCGIDGTNPCQCELVWNETNTVGSNSQTVTRTRRFSVIEVQSGLVKCKTTVAFWTEIASGTTINMNIIPVTQSGNLTGLNVQKLAYRTGTRTDSQGNFYDSTLTPFINIKHYTCHSRNTSYHEILNKTTTMEGIETGGNIPEINVLLGNKFCSGASGTGCATPRNGFSAQNYYRNLYVRSDKMHINSQNSFYECPKVEEPLQYSSGDTIPAGESGQYWPLDSTFSLAAEASSEWSVPVAAASALYKAGDPNTGTSDGACTNEPDPSGASSRRLKETGIVSKCLGYAKTPKADGTCGSITDSNGRVRPMVRLRRFRTLYPSFYDPARNFAPRNRYPEADEVYIADRLVLNNLGVPTGDLIYGPKPCNFAWFDHEGVVKRDGVVNFRSNILGDGGFATPGYVGTNKFYAIRGVTPYAVNPDGLILPNKDIHSDFISGLTIQPYCSATIPVVVESMGAPSSVRLLTTNLNRADSLVVDTKTFYLNEVHVRPVEAWSPDYLEDKTFQACVPLADPFLEPPMHFYADNTSGSQYMAWCTKPYPTQNPYWTELNKVRTLANTTDPAVLYPGWTIPQSQVPHFTSFSTAGTLIPNNTSVAGGCIGNQNICLKTLGAGSPILNTCKTFLGESVARNTCDRTVRYEAGKTFKTFPLQAKDTDIVDMLKNDKNFSCTYSVSSDASKVNAKVPSSGCCGYYNGSKVLNSILGAANKNGHLEPYINPAFPTVRFCGSPVQ